LWGVCATFPSARYRRCQDATHSSSICGRTSTRANSNCTGNSTAGKTGRRRSSMPGRQQDQISPIWDTIALPPTGFPALAKPGSRDGRAGLL
jgi:hypothetical protein